MQSSKSFETLTNGGCWERANARSGGLQEWALLEICAEDFCLSTKQPSDKHPKVLLPAVVTLRQAAVVSNAGPKRQKLEGVLLERDINLHVDVEGEIVRGWIHIHRKYTCSRAYLGVHTYVVINQSSPLPISSFLPFSPVPSSIYQNSPTHIHTSMS